MSLLERVRPVLTWESLVLLLLASSCLVNVLQARELKALRYQVMNPAKPNGFKEGDQFPTSIEGRSLEGLRTTASVGAGGKPTVLYILRSGCSWCTRNAANFTALAEHLRPTHQVIVLAQDSDLEPLRTYTANTYPGFPVVWQLPADLLEKFGGTPQTIVVSAKGVVEKNWAGAYASQTLDGIESFFGVRLPGLSPAGK